MTQHVEATGSGKEVLSNLQSKTITPLQYQ